MSNKAKAGSTIRRLARFRRTVTIVSFAGAGFLVVMTPLLFVSLGQGYVAVAVIVLAVNVIVWLVCFGSIYWNKARLCDRGALGEEQLELVLQPLVRLGWTIQYNLRLRWGDADVFLTSPRGKHYVIDVKSHKGGTVFFDSKPQTLMRRYETAVYDLGKDSYGKSKDWLKSVKGQALELARSKRLRWVTPIICFTQIDLDPTITPDKPLQGVYVVSLDSLLDLFNRLENRNTPKPTPRSEPTMESPTADNGWINTLDSKDPEILSKARNIIAHNIYCVLSTATPDGLPWVSPVFFAYDDSYTIYWCSAVASRHSQNLYANQGRVAIAIFDSTAPAGTGSGLYFSGTATEETEPERINKAFKLLAHRAEKNLERTAADYQGSSPRRIYRFVPDSTWVSGERVPAGNQLVDTKIPIQLVQL